MVTPLPPPVGGIGSWAETLLRSALPRHFDLRVLDTSPPQKGSVRSGNRPRFGRAWSSLRSLLRSLRLLRQHRPQIVHVNSSYYWGFLRDGAIVWLSAWMGARVLMHLHGGDFDVFLEACPRPARRIVLKTLQRCDGVIVLTRDTQAQLGRALDPARVHRLPNFVQTGLFAGSDRTDTGPAAKVEVLFVGWVIETKGVRELLDAARSLPGARFTLVGPVDADFHASISGELEELGERVRLLGRLPHHETVALYGQCDVFVLPTHREGFPVSVLEAMAASLPVVATPVGAIPDVVREGREGHLVPVRDASALARRLRELVEDPARRRAMGCAARERVERHFCVEIVVAELEALYDSLLGAGGAG